MALNPLVDTRDNRFVLFELLETDKMNRLQKYADFDRTTYESILELAEKIATQQFYPANREADKIACQYVAATKEVKVPPCIKPAIKAYNEAGFVALSLDQEDGGAGMPQVIHKGCMEYFTAASMASTMYPSLTFGAANLIRNFGAEEMKKTYLEENVFRRVGRDHVLDRTQRRIRCRRAQD